MTTNDNSFHEEDIELARPDIETVIAELTPGHKTRRWVLISVALIAFAVGMALSYQFLIRERVDPDLLISDAKLMMGRDEFEGAIPKLKLAYEHDGDNPEICTLLAICFDRIGKVSEAIRWQREAVRIEPGNPNLRMRLALLLEKEGRIGEAIGEWERIAELQPDDPYAKDKLEELRMKGDRLTAPSTE